MQPWGRPAGGTRGYYPSPQANPAPQPPQNDVFGSGTSKNIILGWLGGGVSLRGRVAPSGTASRPSPGLHKNSEKLVVFLSKAQNALFASKNKGTSKIARFFHRGANSGFGKRAFQKTKCSACTGRTPLHAENTFFFMGGPYKNGDPARHGPGWVGAHIAP